MTKEKGKKTPPVEAAPSRPTVSLEELIERYPKVSSVEASGLLYATTRVTRKPPDPGLFTELEDLITFLTGIGSETVITEPLPALRLEARKVLVRHVLTGLLTRRDVMSDVKEAAEQSVIFFAADPAHAKLPPRDLEILQQFLERFLLASKKVCFVPDDTFMLALVHAEHFTFLEEQCWTRAIPYLFNRLREEIVNGPGGYAWDLGPHSEFLADWRHKDSYAIEPRIVLDTTALLAVCGHFTPGCLAARISKTLLALAALEISALHRNGQLPTLHLPGRKPPRK